VATLPTSPRSPASTKGPYMIATRFGLSGMLSKPAGHGQHDVDAIALLPFALKLSPQEDAVESATMDFPLTFTEGVLAAQ